MRKIEKKQKKEKRKKKIPDLFQEDIYVSRNWKNIDVKFRDIMIERLSIREKKLIFPINENQLTLIYSILH